MLHVQQSPEFGTVQLHENGSFTYTPKDHYFGEIDRIILADERGKLSIRVVQEPAPIDRPGPSTAAAEAYQRANSGDRTLVIR